MRRAAGKRGAAGLALALAAFVLALAAAPGAGAATLPSGFTEQTVFSGLHAPLNFKFAPDGRVFVAEKSGKILVYENLQDQTPEVFANLAKPVYDFEDHGLLGLALDPKFDSGRPYVYALYTFNHKLADKGTQTPLVSDPKSVTPAWPEYKGPGAFENDKCPEGEEVERKEIPKELIGCEVSGLLVRLTAEGNHAAPSAAAPKEEVLLEGWCQQSTTHSVGDLGFGPEGALFVTGGEGAMFSEPDYGQFGNVCKDPPENGNPNPVRLTAEGGSLRSQSVLRAHDATHPTLLSGTMLRVDPDTGEAWPGNPFATGPSVELNARRIFAFGFRNPWRFAFNNRTRNVFVDNVGNGHFEEMDRIGLDESSALNSGWPCYEGGQNGANTRNIEYVGENPAFWINACKALYTKEDEGHPQTAAPFFAYEHSGPIAPGDPCVKPFTDIAGISFYEASAYPAEYKNALFFSDAIRGCIYVMKAGANGEPDPATVTSFLSGSASFSFPGVDIEQGPEGNIFYSEFGSEYLTNKTGSTSGAIKRIVFPAGPAPPAPGPPAPTPVPVYQPVKIKKRPAKSTKSRTAKFVFGAEAGLRFQCRIDKKKFGSCHSPRTYKHLKPGKHTFRVRPIDSAGVQAAKATTFQWKIVKG